MTHKPLREWASFLRHLPQLTPPVGNLVSFCLGKMLCLFWEVSSQGVQNQLPKGGLVPPCRPRGVAFPNPLRETLDPPITQVSCCPCEMRVREPGRPTLQHPHLKMEAASSRTRTQTTPQG